jgi:transcription factor SFP1
MPAPIDIASRPQAGQPKSNLTSQLHAARDMPMMMNESYGARSGSISQYAGGIPMSSSRIRRESMMNGDLARSLMNNGGLSWGAGVSVGSWIRDE